MYQIKSCPCGESEDIGVFHDADGSKWANVTGTCCGMWSVEFRTLYNQPGKDDDALMVLAIEAWNSAPRGTP